MTANPAHRLTRVGIADDHQAYRNVLVDQLRQYPNEIELLADVAGNAKDAIRLAERYQPDVLLLDLCMPLSRTLGGKQLQHGVTVLREVKNIAPQTRLLIISHTSTDPRDFGFLHKIYSIGINGYIAKRDESEQDIVGAIARIMRGETYFSISMGRIFRNLTSLTDREIEVFNLMVCGSANKDIGKQLEIEVRTVMTHVSNVLGKLEISSRDELRGPDEFDPA